MKQTVWDITNDLEKNILRIMEIVQSLPEGENKEQLIHAKRGVDSINE
jgi:hypothetical protein